MIFHKIENIRARIRGRYPLELLKFLEIEALKRHASTKCWHHPSFVLVELTTRCNLRCKWCNQSDDNWRKHHGGRDMPFELFERIVPQLEGSRRILLYNIGEPLLYPELYEAITFARRYIPEVIITTNGLLLTRSISKKLEAAGLSQLNVSIDSPDRAVMKQIRGADLDVITKKLIDFGKVTRIPVEIWTVISRANLQTLHELPRWASRIPAVKSIRFQLQNGVEKGVEKGLPPLDDPKAFNRLQQEVAQRCAALGIRTDIQSLPFYPEGFHQKQARGICKAPFTQLVSINVKGELLPCCSFPTMSLGNVGDDGFKALWNGKKMRAWRRDMLEENYCAYCSEWCGYKPRQR